MIDRSCKRKNVDSALQQARRFDEEYIIGAFFEDGGQGCEEAAEHGLLLRQRESLLAQYSVRIFLRSNARKRRYDIDICDAFRESKNKNTDAPPPSPGRLLHH